MTLGFVSSNADPCIYIREVSGSKVIIPVYVDDPVFMTDTETQMCEIKQSLASQFDIKDFGPLHYWSIWFMCVSPILGYNGLFFIGHHLQ